MGVCAKEGAFLIEIFANMKINVFLCTQFFIRELFIKHFKSNNYVRN